MEINTEKLYVGQTFKNYIELCVFLEQKVVYGRSRQLQLKDWERYFRYSKKGQKIIIEEIYDEPLPKIDNRGKSEGSRNNYKGIYAEYIDVLLLQFLEPSKNKLKIYTTNNMIAEGCGIVNYNYRTALENRWKLYTIVKEKFDIESNIYCMIDVFSIIKTKIREIVKSSLDRLKKAEKLDYEVCYLVYIPYISREPIEAELQCIITAEEETMQEMGVERKAQIDNNEKLQKEFRKKVLEKVQKEFNYIKSIYMGYAIVLCEDIIALSVSEKKDLRAKLNEIVVESLKEKPQQIRDKTKKQEGIGGWIGSRSPFWSKWVFDRMSNKYIQQCFDFIDILCNLYAENIVQKIISCNDVKRPSYRTRREKEDLKEEDIIIEQLLDEIEDE